MSQLLIAALLVSAAIPAAAAESAGFLTIGPGARALGMGGAYSALGGDAGAIYWNPAGLSRVERREFTASHAELFESTRHDFAAHAHPVRVGVIGGALTYLSQGRIEGRDTQGRPTGGFDASDAALSLAYARRTELIEFGAAIKYIRSHIGSTEAQGAAVDLGVRREWGALGVGGALRNLGPGLRFADQRNDLPLRLAAGASWKPECHIVAIEGVNGPRGAGTDVSVGGELCAAKPLRLRAGYTTQTSVSGGSGFDAARGLTLGLGVQNDAWSVDYAVLPTGELGRSHRFSFSARW
ncbi:MAG: PorV/PorQ family protein [Armatimonadota bacterium]